jgi:hypothetical protein
MTLRVTITRNPENGRWVASTWMPTDRHTGNGSDEVQIKVEADERTLALQALHRAVEVQRERRELASHYEVLEVEW